MNDELSKEHSHLSYADVSLHVEGIADQPLQVMTRWNFACNKFDAKVKD